MLLPPELVTVVDPLPAPCIVRPLLRFRLLFHVKLPEGIVIVSPAVAAVTFDWQSDKEPSQEVVVAWGVP